MIAVDTSVVVAGFASWHEGHAHALKALAQAPRVPAHVLVESYSVLTRLPPPHRAPAELVTEFLNQRFPEAPLVLPARAHRQLLGAASQAQLVGGAIYDVLIAMTTRRAGATLLTRDQRAQRVYEAVGVDYRLLD